MSNEKTEDWCDKEKKNEAVYKVLRYLAENPSEGAGSVGNDEKARQLFEKVGGIQVPADARVIIFASGEKALEHCGSVVLEVPSGGSAQADDNQLKKFVLGNYPYWPPTLKKT